MSAAFILIFCCVTLCCAVSGQQCRDSFTAIQGLLCIRSEFVETPQGSWPASEVQCSLLCSAKSRCQAFSVADGPCQLFVFDRCSKDVRICGCSRTGRVFVKRQPGLQGGKLCPTGYGDDLCGVKYKLYSSPSNWEQARQVCKSESGLVIMADVMNPAEMSYVDEKYKSEYYNYGRTIWLGGNQAPVVPNSKVGWYWVGCNLTVSEGLWGTTEPNNFLVNEIVIGRYSAYPGLSDFPVSFSFATAVLCECLSPFD